MKLLDVNILIYAYRPDSAFHAPLRRWLEAVIDSGEPIGLSDLALSGFLRIVTHSRVFPVPSTLPDALDFVNYLLSLPSATVIQPGPRHWEMFVGLCRGHDLRGAQIPDAYFAALAWEQEAEWITMDRGFARYAGLKWSKPVS